MPTSLTVVAVDTANPSNLPTPLTARRLQLAGLLPVSRQLSRKSPAPEEREECHNNYLFHSGSWLSAGFLKRASAEKILQISLMLPLE